MWAAARSAAGIGPRRVGYDLIQTDPTTGGFPRATTDIVGQNPLLGPLADNGGATPTMALMPGSPALGAADVPQRARPTSAAQRGPAGVDTESTPTSGPSRTAPATWSRRTADAAADGTLRAAVAWANQSINPLLSAPAPNVIRFDTGGAFATAQTLDLTMIGDTTVGPSALAITGDVEIEGPTSDGDGVTISAAGSACRCGCSTWRKAAA